MKYLSALLLAVFILGCSAGASESDSRSTPTDDPAVAELQNKVDSLENLVAGQLTTIRDLTIRLEAVELNDGVTPTKYAEGYMVWDNGSYLHMNTNEFKISSEFANEVAQKLDIVNNPNALDELSSTENTFGDQTVINLNFTTNSGKETSLISVFPTEYSALFKEEIPNRITFHTNVSKYFGEFGSDGLGTHFYIKVPE